MKIPYGYGACRFNIWTGSEWQNIDIKIDGNTFPVDIDVGYSFNNIYGNKVRDVDYIRRSWNVRLINNDGTQADIINLIVNLQISPSGFFYFYPHYPGGDDAPLEWGNWSQRKHQLCRYICTISKPALQNLVNGFLGSGQILSMPVDVRDKISVTDDKYQYIPYRDTSTGDWETYPLIGSDPLSVQSPMIGIITT